MKTVPAKPTRSDAPRMRRGIFGLAAGLAVAATGCSTVFEMTAMPAGPYHRPGNVFRGAESLPRGLKRVAVLPLVTKPGHQAMASARDGLEASLLGEIAKTGRFELVPVSAARLKVWTGRADWATTEELPPGFVDRIRTETACDAVLFAQLTDFRAYPPLAVGWRLRLVDSDGVRVWWAADEIFDAGEAPVANAARRYHMEHAPKPLALADAQQILYSPQRFGTYTASALVGTCPERSEK